MQYDDATNPAVSADLRADPEVAAAATPGDLNPTGVDDDQEEVEHQGQFYKIPKALKGAFLMQADYTRKTQELADHRRQLDEDRKAHEAHVESAQGNIADQAQLHLLEQQVEAFESVDWEALAQADPQQAQMLWAQFQETQEVRDRYAWALAHHAHQGRLEAERAAAAQLAETGRVLSQKIEGWSPEIAAKLVEYAGAFGVTLDELREIADPRLWIILHRAHSGDQAAQQEAAAKNLAQTQAVRPAISVSGGAAPGGAVRDEMATGEWMKRRNEQSRRAR